MMMMMMMRLCVVVTINQSYICIVYSCGVTRQRPLAGHEVSRIVSCVVAKHADETAYLGNLAPKTTKNPKTRNYQIAHHYLE